MQSYPRPLIASAVALAVLAGFVDGFAFTSMGGFFVSFMSGNTTRFGVALGTHALSEARMAMALVLAFVAGVMGAAIVARRVAKWRKPAAMALATLLIVLAALAARVSPGTLPLLLLAAAMGAENGVFVRDGEVSVGVTYFTGNLVRMGQRLAAALMDVGGRWDWAPYGLLWLGFAAGAVSGTRAYLAMGAEALWLAAIGGVVLTIMLGLVSRAETRRPVVVVNGFKPD